MNRVNVPTRAENLALAIRAKAGDMAARNELIERNMPIVHRIAAAMARGRDIDDLKQQAVFGLIRAIELFDPSLGLSFCTYAITWVKQAIGLYIQQDLLVRVPIYLTHNSPASRKEPADPRKRRERATNRHRAACAMTPFQSLSDPTGEGTTVAELIVDGSEPPDLDTRAEVARLRRAIGKLDRHARYILAHRYGLDGAPERTLEQIGRTLGRCRERIRQMQREAEAALLEQLEVA